MTLGNFLLASAATVGLLGVVAAYYTKSLKVTMGALCLTLFLMVAGVTVL